MKRILLIEPGFYQRVDLEDTLSPHSFQVTSVKDRFSALMKLKSQVFNMIMTSMREDIKELMFLLKSLRDTGTTIPIVVLSTTPTAETVQRLSRFQPIEIIVQPYSIKQLVQRLDQISGG